MPFGDLSRYGERIVHIAPGENMLVVLWMIEFVYVWTNTEGYVLFTLAFVFQEDRKWKEHMKLFLFLRLPLFLCLCREIRK